jgi:hypothetical protein
MASSICSDSTDHNARINWWMEIAILWGALVLVITFWP